MGSGDSARTRPALAYAGAAWSATMAELGIFRGAGKAGVLTAPERSDACQGSGLSENPEPVEERRPGKGAPGQRGAPFSWDRRSMSRLRPERGMPIQSGRFAAS
jgi:hypothetical protein